MAALLGVIGFGAIAEAPSATNAAAACENGNACGRHLRLSSLGLKAVVQHCGALLNSDARPWKPGRPTPHVCGCIADGVKVRGAETELITDPEGGKPTTNIMRDSTRLGTCEIAGILAAQPALHS